MQKYGRNASSMVRIEYGIELAAGLRGFDETTALADEFVQVNDALLEALEAKRARRKPYLEARAALRIGEYLTDQVIRTFSRAVEVAEGGRRGPLYDSVFPQGLTSVVAPAGTRQLEPTAQLVDRVKKSKAPGADKLRKEWGKRLADAHARLAGAVGTYTTARKDVLDAYTTELAARDEHRLAVDRLVGLVRATFPGDTARQNAVFPVTDHGPGADDEPQADQAGPTDTAPTA